jgi:glucose-6-phosphate 1-dehydrogenase
MKPSTGYESLLYDVLVGNPALYNRADNIEAGWKKVQPILDAVKAGTAKLYTYETGSEGPKEADELLARDGNSWRPLA